VLNVLKSGSLNLLEPSGPVQVCNGITLLYLTLKVFQFFGTTTPEDNDLATQIMQPINMANKTSYGLPLR
jgi:hypothetical protein